MSNRLKMANIHAIIGLLEQDWSYRRISRELGADRETVARYDRLRLDRSNPAIVTVFGIALSIFMTRDSEDRSSNFLDGLCEPA